MKKIVVLILISAFLSCKSKKNGTTTVAEPYNRYVKVAVDEVIAIKTNRAYDLGRRLLETCNTSRFKTFTKNEATDKVIQNATVEKITKTCQKMNNRNGKFIDLQLIEVIHDVETDNYQFRYKIIYEKKYFERELSVVVNPENKVDAISTKEVPKKPL
ncbi:hypothetical protein [Flavobacterium sp.]|uniref:hypothetical protein n=1 Tax=Flavobacterium sp. TaxID=239 RepID=UPI0037502973